MKTQTAVDAERAQWELETWEGHSRKIDALRAKVEVAEQRAERLTFALAAIVLRPSYAFDIAKAALAKAQP